MAIFPSILKVLLAILGMVWLFRQVRKPSGPLGKRVVRPMNLGHATMTDWGLQQVMVPKNAVILDVGCGGGRTRLRLSAMAPEGKLFGLDYSAASIVAETYRGGPLRLLYGIVMPLLHAAFLSDVEHRALLSEAGFTEVATKHPAGKNWICATGRRPT